MGPNVWPTELPGFQQDIESYYDQTTQMAAGIYAGFAVVLGERPVSTAAAAAAAVVAVAVAVAAAVTAAVAIDVARDPYVFSVCLV